MAGCSASIQIKLNHMNSANKKIVLIVILLLGIYSLNAQTETTRQQWKLQFAIGLNNPIEDGSTVGYFSEYANFPTIGIGVQYMFEPDWGVKLDFGYNRSSETGNSFPFVLNYSRVNAQIVYDATNVIGFLPNRLGLVGHVGPGLSFTTPAAPYSDNTYTFLNLLTGVELNYRLSNTLSIYGDLSYAFSLAGSDKYDLNVDGFSFNGDLIYLTLGLTINLN